MIKSCIKYHRRNKLIRKDYSEEPSFSQLALSQKDMKWKSHWLKKVLDMVNWSEFESILNNQYSQKDGRPAWEPLSLFKCLLLQQWYTMSDRQLEEALEFRIDFCKFTCISFEQNAPDATTFVKFRVRIHPVWDKLLKIINDQIEAAGFEIKKAVSVDATLVCAHSKPCGTKPSCDPDASWRGFPAKQIEDNDGNKVLARRPALFGYKINLNTSVGSGFVNDFSVCKASEHETHHMAELLSPDTKIVYADKGYVGNKALLKDLKIVDGIQSKAFRGNKLSKSEINRNKKITKRRRIVEGVFGIFKNWYGWHKTKYIGLLRNCLAVTLTSLAYNMKKWAVLSK